MESKGSILGKIASRKRWPVFSLSKPEIAELPQPIEKTTTMARVTGSRVVWSDV